MSNFTGLSYSVGSLLRRDIKADRDGGAVSILREAGAIPLCVTNTPELCASIETYNMITGYTSNPYDFTRTSGGSSGGEVRVFILFFKFKVNLEKNLKKIICKVQ